MRLQPFHKSAAVNTCFELVTVNCCGSEKGGRGGGSQPRIPARHRHMASICELLRPLHLNHKCAKEVVLRCKEGLNMSICICKRMCLLVDISSWKGKCMNVFCLVPSELVEKKDTPSSGVVYYGMCGMLGLNLCFHSQNLLVANIRVGILNRFHPENPSKWRSCGNSW